VGILDLLRKSRQDDEDEDEDEDSQNGGEESDDEDSGGGGLWGALRGIGGNAAGLLGKVLKRGGDGDDEDDGDDEVTGPAAAAPSRLAAAVSPGESVEKSVVFSSSDGSPNEEDPAPLTNEAPVTGTPAEVPEAPGNHDLGDLFTVRMEFDPVLRELAMSQDVITAHQLADELGELLGHFTSMVPSE
jgi:hypothetical protein